MKVLVWNIRGIANSEFQLALKYFCLNEKLDILFISELKIEHQNLPYRFWNQCGMKFIIANNRGQNMCNLWLCSKIGQDVHVISSTSQHITINIVFNGKTSIIIGVYVSTSYVTRKKKSMVRFYVVTRS